MRRRRPRFSVVVALLIAAAVGMASGMSVGMGGGTAWAAKPPPLGEDESPSLLPAPAPEPPPARAYRANRRLKSSGSGFVVAPGLLLTNAHVVRGCAEVLARNAAGRTARTKLRREDAGRDLALVAVPRDFGPPLAFRDAPAVLRGDDVVTYGFPLTGLLSSGPTLTTGTISALTGLRDTPLHYTISAPVQPGNSGGPLLDLQGHVVGVVVAKLNAAQVAKLTGGDIPQNVNFAVKGGEVMAFLRAAGTTPRTAPSTGPDLHASAVGQIANPATAYMQCLR